MPPRDGRWQPQKEETLVSLGAGRWGPAPKGGDLHILQGLQVGVGPKKRGPCAPVFFYDQSWLEPPITGAFPQNISHPSPEGATPNDLGMQKNKSESFSPPTLAPAPSPGPHYQR